MKASEFIALKDDAPFWGKEHYDDPISEAEILVRHGNAIYGLGWDEPINIDAVEFIEYVKPVGWKPPTEEQLEITQTLVDDMERAIMFGAKVEGDEA